MTKTREPLCHWDGSIWLSPQHLANCRVDCKGCKPCPDTHCAMRGSCPHHVEDGLVTCPRCIGRVRRDLNAIETLYAIDMPEEAIVAGVDSEAFVLAGAAAAPDQYAARRAWNEEVDEATNWRRGYCAFPRDIDTDDHHHPYLVLGRWDIQLRDKYGPNTDLFVTVTSAANFLRNLLAGSFPHSREFEDFARELATCRAHLEAVAHDSRTPEQGRPCPRCVEATGKGPRLRKRYAIGDTDAVKRGDLDTWHCTLEPEHWWSDRDYRDKVAVDYIQHATALTADQIAQRFEVKAGTVRVWATREKIRKRGKDHLGRQLYDVADALLQVKDAPSATA